MAFHGRGPLGRRPFFIVSELNGKVLDIHGSSTHGGAKVCMYHKKSDNNSNQLWYLDDNQNIRSCLNEFALECSSQGDKIKMESFRGDARQQWIIQGNRIVNRVIPLECLDIERGNKDDGANVIAWKYKGSPNQHWRIDHA